MAGGCRHLAHPAADETDNSHGPLEPRRRGSDPARAVLSAAVARVLAVEPGDATRATSERVLRSLSRHDAVLPLEKHASGSRHGRRAPVVEAGAAARRGGARGAASSTPCPRSGAATCAIASERGPAASFGVPRGGGRPGAVSRRRPRAPRGGLGRGRTVPIAQRRSSSMAAQGSSSPTAPLLLPIWRRLEHAPQIGVDTGGSIMPRRTRVAAPIHFNAPHGPPAQWTARAHCSG